MVSPKVKEWEACELRYVAEGKLNRLSDEDLVELERLLIARLGNEPPAKPGASRRAFDIVWQIAQIVVAICLLRSLGIYEDIGMLFAIR